MYGHNTISVISELVILFVIHSLSNWQEALLCRGRRERFAWPAGGANLTGPLWGFCRARRQLGEDKTEPRGRTY